MSDLPTPSTKPVATGTIHTIEFGPPSDMPEINWLWRRVYIFLVTAGASYETDKLALRVTDQKLLHSIIGYLVAIIALMALLYIAGASSENITKLVGAIKTTRKETISTAESTTQQLNVPDTTTATINSGGQDDATQSRRNDESDPQSTGGSATATATVRTASPATGGSNSDGTSDPADSTDPILRRPAI